MHNKVDEWKSIMEVLDTITVKSLEMAEKAKSMDFTSCQRMINNIEEMSHIIQNISDSLVNSNKLLTALKQLKNNSFFHDVNIQYHLEQLPDTQASIRRHSGTCMHQTIPAGPQSARG